MNSSSTSRSHNLRVSSEYSACITLLAVLLPFALTGCIKATLVTIASSASQISSLTLSPSTKTLAVGNSYTFTAAGGTSPYTYSIVSGGGSIATTGLFTAPGTAGTTEIKVTDSFGNIATAVITTNPALSLSPSIAYVTVPTTHTTTFAASGAVPTYGYSITSGPGTLDSSTGAYSNSGTSGPTVVQGYDSIGNTTTAQIQNVRFRVNGTVSAIVRSGSSVYVGGQFNAAHPRVANGFVAMNTTTFDPVCNIGSGFDAEVQTMLVTTTAIYLGGDFTEFNGQSANRIAKLDKTTCVLDTTFTPSGSNGFDSTVSAMVISGTSLYVGGSFTAYKGVANSANRLAKLDLTTGELDTVFSPVGAAANGFGGAVNALAVSGTSLYVGGGFTAYKGVANSANRLAKLDLTTGELDTTFSPAGATSNGFGGTVNTLLVSGTSLYVGGTFSAYKGTANSALRLAKLDLTSGVIDTVFSPPGAGANGFGGSVEALAVSGTSLYVGGIFTAYRGVANSASRIAKLNLTNGVIDTVFSPPGASANGFDNSVLSLNVVGGTLYVSGSFTTYRGTTTENSSVARLNPSTGALETAGFMPTGSTATGWDSIVRVFALSGTTLYAAGEFQGYGGLSAKNIAKFDATTFALDTTFSPPSANGFNNKVNQLLVSGSSLYVGGLFTEYRGVANSANKLAKLDLTSGAIDTVFSPPGATTNGFTSTSAEVNALASAGTSLFVGGSFTAYRGVADSANRIAKLDLTTGELDTVFSPGGAANNGFGNNAVNALAVAGTSVYAGGTFTSYKGVANAAVTLAKLDQTSGEIDTVFSPVGATANGFQDTVSAYVRSLSASATALYVGGGFSRYRGVVNSALNFAKLDLTTGVQDTAFSPPGASANGFGQPVSVVYVSGTSVYVGGNFLTYQLTGDISRFIAKIDTASGAIDTVFTSVTQRGMDSVVSALHVSGTTLYIGGGFKIFAGDGVTQKNARYIVPLHATTGALLDD